MLLLNQTILDFYLATIETGLIETLVVGAKISQAIARIKQI